MLALVVAALNAAEKIKEVGSYAGFAAVLGLAVLSVLYFGQARELKRLREWAGRAPERAAEMQQRVVADVQRRTAPPAAPAVPPVQRPPASAPATAGGAAAAAPPGAATPGAGQPGAVPSTANGATRPAGQPVPAAAGVAPAGAGAAAAGAAAATGSAAAPPKEPATPGTVPPAGQPTQALPALGGSPGAPASPVTPARAAAGQAPPSPAAPAPKPAAPPAAAPARAAGIPSTTLPPRTAAGAAAVARAGDPYDDDDDDGRSPARVTLAIIGGVLVVIVLAVLLVTQVLGGNDSPTPAAPNTIAQPATSTPATGTPAAAPVNRSATTVFVQNGTRINGAARGAANRLETRGYKIGGTATAVDQTLAATRVAYTQGHRREALDVAKLLAVSAANVTGAGPNDAVAGGNADVVVTIGLDKAQ